MGEGGRHASLDNECEVLVVYVMSFGGMRRRTASVSDGKLSRVRHRALEGAQGKTASDLRTSQGERRRGGHH
jgi:hypothetical protein